MTALSATSLDDAQHKDIHAVLGTKYVEENAHEVMDKGQLPFYPSITNGYLEDHPITLFNKGVSSNIPVLSGTNTDETTLWEPTRFQS